MDYEEGTYTIIEFEGQKIKVSNKKQTQPSDLGSKLYFPTPAEMLEIEKQMLETRLMSSKINQMNRDIVSLAVKYFVEKGKEEQNGGK